MSNTVWSEDKGWHDGPEVHITLKDGRLATLPRYAPCPAHPGQWFNQSGGACSCGQAHSAWKVTQ